MSELMWAAINAESVRQYNTKQAEEILEFHQAVADKARLEAEEAQRVLEEGDAYSRYYEEG